MRTTSKVYLDTANWNELAEGKVDCERFDRAMKNR